MQCLTKLILKQRGISKNISRTKHTHREEILTQIHTQTRCTRAKSQHSLIAFLAIPGTRFQVTGHPRRTILPILCIEHWPKQNQLCTANCMTSNLWKYNLTPWVTKVKAQPGPWPQFLPPLVPTSFSVRAVAGSRAVQKREVSARQISTTVHHQKERIRQDEGHTRFRS